MRGVRGRRRVVVPSAPVRGMRACRLLRLLAGQHASAHAAATGHPVVRSYEPGEAWFWDYRTQDFAEGPELAPPQHHPVDQTVPGPAERVPDDWANQLH